MSENLVKASNDTQEIVATLAPLAETFLRSQIEEHEQRAKMHAQQMEVAKMQNENTHQFNQQLLKFHRHQFNLVFVLITVIVVFVLGLTAGLVFWAKDVKTGLLVLSHAVALASGYFIRKPASKNQSGTER